MKEQIPHSHTLPRENNGIANLDPYQDCPLPEDYEITELLGDVIQVEYADVSEDGDHIERNGLFIPLNAINNRAWRVGKVILAGPNAKQVKKGNTVIFPGDKGLPGIQRNGKMTVFLNEDRIFGICNKTKK